MGRVIYSATKSQFIQDWARRDILNKMIIGASRHHIGVGDSERKSWGENANAIAGLLTLANAVPNDAVVAFEYKVPNGGRIDCMMYGKGQDGLSHVAHIELKQWSNDSVHELYDNGVFEVEAFTGGGYRPVSHPLKQVAGYHRHLLNKLEVLSDGSFSLDGMAYCYNYSSTASPNDLYAPQYLPLIETFKLYSKEEANELSVRLNKILCLGDGMSVFNRVIESPLMPTGRLLDSAANIFRGITEYALLQEQITASDTIYAEVRRRLGDGGKTAIVIKGGPGTGKTLIALHVLADLAKAGVYRNCYFTTRSKALRENLKLRLQQVPLEDQEDALNAADLITNIFEYKPYHFKENEIDVLLVDEAHRIGRSANFQTDKKYETTFLSQTMSLLYCSKVCVFFIDDHQAVKSSEIGTSEKIEAIARDYHAQFENEREAFLREIEKKEKSLQKKKLARQRLFERQGEMDMRDFAHQLAKLDDDIRELESQVAKKACIEDATQHFEGDVKVIQMELKTQFRCNGSDNYLDWIDDVLFNPPSEIHNTFSDQEYDFKVFDSPQELYDSIKAINDAGSLARVAAGYCWKWSDSLEPNGDLRKDVVIGDFRMPWETKDGHRPRPPFRNRYASSADTWATEPAGINQIGCIFSIQGLEVDYMGVIIGPDLDYDPATDALVAVPGKNMDVKTGDAEIYEKHIKNIYRVLLTRGAKGCYIYSCNPGVSEYLLRCRKP